MGLCASLFPEKIDAWHLDPQTGHGLDSGTIESSGSARQGRNEMIEIEESSGNVYADLGMADAGEMIVKAQLATKIGEIIKGRKWSQQQAADVLGIPQSKLSKMLRGQFRGISEAKMLDCLARLGRDVQIVVGPARRSASVGHVAVVFV
jgi:predicted XRE-type DNA-binding protein